MVEDTRIEEWRSEFWNGFNHILHKFFDPCLGDFKAAWKSDSRDQRSTAYDCIELRVALEECSLERIRVRVIPIIQWAKDTPCITYECDPLAGERVLVNPKDGSVYSECMPGVVRSWIMFMVVTRLRSEGYAVGMSVQDTHLQLIVCREWGPTFIKLRLYGVLSEDPSVFLRVYFFERVYLSITANPKMRSTPLPIADAQALWQFIQTELDTPWSTWPWLEPQLPLSMVEMSKLPVLELGDEMKKRKRS